MFLQAIPTGPCRLSPFQFATAVRLRLGIDHPFITSGVKCDCKRHTAIDRQGIHLQCCSKGGDFQVRHDAIASELKALSASAGCKTVWQPKHCFPVKCVNGKLDTLEKVPDLLIRNPGTVKGVISSSSPQDLLIDVQVNCPLAKSFGSLNTSFKAKCTKYSGLSSSNNLAFLPIIVDVYGNWHDKSFELVRSLVNRVCELNLHCIEPSVLLSYWLRRFSCVMYKSQADLLYGKFNRALDSLQGSSMVNDESRNLTLVSSKCH